MVNKGVLEMNTTKVSYLDTVSKHLSWKPDCLDVQKGASSLNLE